MIRGGRIHRARAEKLRDLVTTRSPVVLHDVDSSYSPRVVKELHKGVVEYVDSGDHQGYFFIENSGRRYQVPIRSIESIFGNQIDRNPNYLVAEQRRASTRRRQTA